MSYRSSPSTLPNQVPVRVLATLAMAVPPIAYLHATGGGVIDPTRDALSEYIAVPFGVGLLGLVLAPLAMAAVPLIRGLSRLPRTHLVRMLLVTWSVAVTLAAAFPTNLPGAPFDLSAVVHRYSGAWLFVTLPVACWLLARRLRPADGWSGYALALATASVVGGSLSAALVLNNLPTAFFGASPAIPPGLLQRVAGGMQVVLLVVTAFAVARTAPGRLGVRALLRRTAAA